MKVLYISDYLFMPFCGAYNSARAHLISLSEIVGIENVDVVAVFYDDCPGVKNSLTLFNAIRNKRGKLFNLFSGNPLFWSEKYNIEVYKMIKRNKYDIIFLDNSFFGKIAKYIKKEFPKIKTITYFHGIKYNSCLQGLRMHPFKLGHYLYSYASIHNEKKVVKYSNVLLLLNQRDNDMLKKYYHIATDIFLPVYLQDIAKIQLIKEDDFFHILFVGGTLYANVLGIKWFIDNVMPKLGNDVRLDIVGKGMEVFRDASKCDSRINVWGRVTSLDKYYNMANLVIGPIFHGDGMKTKTAEALMYGKVFAGTNESLCGYVGLDDYRCNTPEEYVYLINKMIAEHTPKYSQKMRDLYEKFYSPDMAKCVISKVIYEMNI